MDRRLREAAALEELPMHASSPQRALSDLSGHSTIAGRWQGYRSTRGAPEPLSGMDAMQNSRRRVVKR